jgi:hypothetical protein
MAKTTAVTFTEATTGKDVLEHIKNLFEADRKLRKKEIQAVAEVNANNFIQNELAELFNSFYTSVGLSRPSSMDFQWLSEVLTNVSSEGDKGNSVQEKLSRLYGPLLKPKDFVEFSNKIMYALDIEFKKIRTLKQAYYYRNRSVKAVINFLEIWNTGYFHKMKVKNESELQNWYIQTKPAFLSSGAGERFTRNSYFSEFEVFLHEVWPGLSGTTSVDTDKSFSNRVTTALSSTEPSLESSPQLNRAYQQLSSYYEKQVEVKTSSGRIDLVLEHGAVEFKAIKGEGLYAYYKPKKDNVELLKDLEAQVLAASFDEESLPDIGTQIVTKPGLLLVIKCLGKPSAQTIKDFERFVSKALH